MKATAANKTPLLLVAVSLIAVGMIIITTRALTSGGSIFFTVTPAAFADDLSAEDIKPARPSTRESDHMPYPTW
jgi:hypothetical protein